MFVACNLPTKTLQRPKHPSPDLYVFVSFCFAVVVQKLELTRTIQHKPCSFWQLLPILVVLLSCQQAKMYCGFQSTEKRCILQLSSPEPTFYLFHTTHTDRVIYSNRLRPTLFITLLSAAYSPQLFSEWKRSNIRNRGHSGHGSWSWELQLIKIWEEFT